MSSHRLKLIFRTKKICKNNYVRLLTTTHTTVYGMIRPLNTMHMECTFLRRRQNILLQLFFEQYIFLKALIGQIHSIV
jgi:hypothetical protein